MGLDQQILAEERDIFPDAHYELILEKRKCYPLHSFVNKWVLDTCGLSLSDWKHTPFGPYVCLPREVIQRFCTALKKRNRGGGYKIYNIWSRPSLNLKIPLSCPKTIPPLVRRELEGQLTPGLLMLTGSYVGGQCKYERMFGDLDQVAWDLYPDEEQEKDMELLGAAMENGRFSNRHFYYSASW